MTPPRLFPHACPQRQDAIGSAPQVPAATPASHRTLLTLSCPYSGRDHSQLIVTASQLPQPTSLTQTSLGTQPRGPAHICTRRQEQPSESAPQLTCKGHQYDTQDHPQGVPEAPGPGDTEGHSPCTFLMGQHHSANQAPISTVGRPTRQAVSRTCCQHVGHGLCERAPVGSSWCDTWAV